MESNTRLLKVRSYLHDIKNTLFIFKVHIHRYRKEKSLDSDAVEATLNKALTQVNNAFRISMNSMEFKIEHRPVSSLHKIIEAYIDEVKQIYPKVLIQYRYLLNPGEKLIYFNEDLIKQVLFNIADNSHGAKATSLLIVCKEMDDGIILRLRDNGKKLISESSNKSTGLGKKIISDNMVAMEGSADFTQIPEGYVVDLYFKQNQSKKN